MAYGTWTTPQEAHGLFLQNGYYADDAQRNASLQWMAQQSTAGNNFDRLGQNAAYNPYMPQQAQTWDTPGGPTRTPARTANPYLPAAGGGYATTPGTTPGISIPPVPQGPTAQNYSTGSTYSGTNGPYAGADWSNAAYNGLNAPTWNPYLANWMDSTVTNAGNQFLQNVAPALDSAAIGAGGYGGDRANIAKGVAAGNYASGLAPAIASMNLQGFDTGANRQLQAGQLGLQGLLGLGGLDLQSQYLGNQQQLGLGALDIQRYNALANMASALSGAAGQPVYGSALGGVLSGALAGYGLNNLFNQYTTPGG